MKKNNLLLPLFFLTIIELNLFSHNHPIGAIDCNEDEWVAKVEMSKNKIIAKSVHLPDGTVRYDQDNLIDGNKDTCWCPKGRGINEFVILKIPKGAKGFRITNGVAKSETLFKDNNRVKTLYWALIAERIYESEGEEDNDICKIRRPGVKLKYCVAFQTAPGYKLIEIKDTISPQMVLFNNYDYFSWDLFKLQKTRSVYLIISIVDVYEGRKYNDTCISEIEIIK